MTPRELANSICDALQRHGYQALLVGGCVRDLLLGRNPADFDVATDATPQQVMEIFPQSLAVGAQFGVVLVPGDGHKVEVATFRTDVGYTDGRHPDRVEYSKTPQEDVARRDFTINGLLMRHDTGEILDFVGGRADLEKHLIRAIGEPVKRFEEDKLRMLRAVRFAARFDYKLEPATLMAIRRLAPQIEVISPERIREELTKMLTEGAARRAFELLDTTHLLPEVLPEIAKLKGVPQPPEYHPEGDVWVHTLMLLEGLPAQASPTLAWGALLHDVGKPATYQPVSVTGDRIRFDGHVDAGVLIGKDILKRLRFSNEQSEQILALVANHMKFKDVSRMKPATLKRFVRQPRFEEHLELHRLDCLSSNGRLDAYNAVRTFLAETPVEQVSPPRLLSGSDLQDMGYCAGPAFQGMLRAIEDAQLNGTVQTREAAEQFVREHYPLKKVGR